MRVSLIFIRDERFFSRPSKKFAKARAKKPFPGNKKHYVLGDPPIGIMYLSAVLKENGHQVSMYDQSHPLYSDESFIDSLKEEQPGLIGISFLSNSTYPGAISLAKKIKESLPSIPIVCGGVFPTINADKIIETHKTIDIVARGEGEEIILDLANQKPLDDIAGITFRSEHGEVISNPDRELIQDLDALPFPDRTGIDIHYVASLPLDVPAVVWPRPYTAVLTSRGCPYKCSFCSCPIFSKHKCRFRSAESILKELEELKQQEFGAFCFVDDNFLLREKRVLEICEKMRERKYSFKWACEGRVDTRKSNIFKEMSAAGCDVLMFGIESGNQRVLDSMQKSTKLEDIENSINKAKKAGISLIHGFFIVGFPGETEEEMRETFIFAEKVPINSFAFNSLTAFRGTPLWEDIVSRNLIDGEKHWDQIFPIHKIDPTALDTELLFKIRSSMVKRLIKRKILFNPFATLKLLFRFLKSMNLSDILDLVNSSKSKPTAQKAKQEEDNKSEAALPTQSTGELLNVN